VHYQLIGVGDSAPGTVYVCPLSSPAGRRVDPDGTLCRLHELGLVSEGVSEGGLGTKLHAVWQPRLYGSHQVKQEGAFLEAVLRTTTHARPEI
jgi:hypothetical protein